MSDDQLGLFAPPTVQTAAGPRLVRGGSRWVDPAVAAREDAIERVERGAGELWMAVAVNALWRLCRTRTSFTCDDLRVIVDDPPDPRAFGPVMRRGRKEGWCSPTDRFETSARVSNHKRPERVWRSEIHDA